jgi:hypothetical protein
LALLLLALASNSVEFVPNVGVGDAFLFDPLQVDHLVLGLGFECDVVLASCGDLAALMVEVGL